MFTDINYWAVLVSAIVYFLLGGLWYALLFAKPWANALAFGPDLKSKAEKDFPKALVCHLISGLLTAYVLAHIAQASGTTSFLEGIVCGFWVWLAFGFTINLNAFMFEKRPSPVFSINGGFYLIAFALLGGILTVWR